jgi:hypothetical protein
MTSSYLLSDDLLHVLILAMSFIILDISLFAYLRRSSGRYFFLLLAFLFLALSQSITFAESFFFSDQLIVIPYVGLHLTHLLDFAMLLSFGLALTKSYAGNTRS